jgi:hypothetical protein
MPPELPEKRNFKTGAFGLQWAAVSAVSDGTSPPAAPRRLGPIRPEFFPCPGRRKSLNRGFGSLDRFSTSLFHPRSPVPLMLLCFRKLPWTYLSVMTG